MKKNPTDAAGIGVDNIWMILLGKAYEVINEDVNVGQGGGWFWQRRIPGNQLTQMGANAVSTAGCYTLHSGPYFALI